MSIPRAQTTGGRRVRGGVEPQAACDVCGARIFDGEREAKLIALPCSKPPKGRARWTLRLLENKVVELGIVDRASDSTIHRTLKKNRLKPHRRKCWVIPPKANSAFVAAMEDVLAVYTRPHDPERVLV